MYRAAVIIFPYNPEYFISAFHKDIYHLVSIFSDQFRFFQQIAGINFHGRELPFRADFR